MTRQPLRRPETDDSVATDPAETGRTRKASRPRAGSDGVDYEAFVAATTASERRAIETAAKTAAALGSVAAWIERAQEQLAETTRTASRVQDETVAIVHDAVGSLGERIGEVERKVETAAPAAVGDALAAIERIETRLSQAPVAPAGAPADFEDALRGFESRITELSQRISTGARPIGRRGLAASAEVDSAVAEIRSHQAGLDAGGPRPGDRMLLPALGTLARSQTAILTTLKADVAKLTQRMDEQAPDPHTHSAALRAEIEALRGSVADVATRDDLGRLERGIQSLTVDVAELRLAAKQDTDIGTLDELRAQVRRLADSQSAASVPSRDLEILSHKLDIVAASGLDPAVVGALAGQVEEVRRLLTSAAAPQALTLVTTHLDGLKRELADLGERQIDAAEFAALRHAVEDMRGALAVPTGGGIPGREMAQAVRDVGQPIETMLVALIDKLDRIEQRVAEPEALDQLEQQVRLLATRIGDAPGRDPALTGLEQSMAELLSEVATWREGAVEAADRAARNAVAETLGTMPSATDIERHLVELREHYELAEERTYEGLLSVHATLEDAMRRISSLEQAPPQVIDSARATPPLRTTSVPPAREIEARSLAPDLHVEEESRPAPHVPPARDPHPALEARPPVLPPRLPMSAPAEADMPLPSRPEDEVLLEPGAGRPVAAQRGQTASADPAADIKSSFIAAARRAAQAAAAESAPQRRQADRAGNPSSKLAGLSPSELARRLRRMIDERRRPLLLSAAALVIAIGTVQIVRRVVGGTPGPQGTVVATRIDPRPAPAALPAPAAAPAPVGTAPQVVGADRPPAVPVAPVPRAPVPDPTTTQAIGPRTPPSPQDEAPRGVVQASVEPRDPPRAPETVAAAQPPALAMPPAIPRAVPEAASPLPPGLKNAASLGDPTALYELAARTAEGRGVPRDPKLAAELFEKAARKGLAPAQYRTGNIYEKGVGIGRDLEAAKTWYRKAAESGNARAMHNLAVLSAEAGAGKPDYAAAIKWFTRAAEHGIRDSQFNLAVLYARGLGTTQDLSKSYLWLAIAAVQGDQDAGRKRDEVATRLSATELARLKGTVERWHAAPIDTAANEVQLPVNGWPEAPIKRAGRGTRA